MSEPKETESGAEDQTDAVTPAEGQGEGTSSPAAAGTDQGEGAEASSTEAAPEAAAAEATAAPKKKKKKREASASASEPETIRDRNARVRAEAAEKRRARREREQGPTRRNLDASEVVDDALARSTHAAAGFVTKHFNKVQWVIVAGLAGWVAWEVYSWRHDRNAEKTSEALFKALAAETGKVGSGDADLGAERGAPSDDRRSFASDEARLKAAQTEYQLAATISGSALAVLGQAGVAYDLGQYKQAQTNYEKVKQDPLFTRDNDVKGRTLEGLGMALEAQHDEEGALKAFRELANMDGANFSALGLYHQARIAQSKGKTDDALKLLEKAGDKLQTLKETPGAIRYLGRQVLELLESIDPKKATELSEKLVSSEAKKQREEAGMAAPGNKNLTPEMQRRIQELMEKMKKEAPPATSGTPMPGPVSPAPEAPAPGSEAPAPEAPTPAPSGAP